MPHYTIFCKNEIKKIKKLLDDMIDKPKSEQLRIRNILRDTYGFYISDFSPVRPYTSDVLELDIANGKITIDRFEPEFGALKGWPKDICSKINISVGQYLRRFNNVKVGITNNPSRRFREHINRNPEKHWERMVVKYETSSITNVNIVEKWFIDNRPELTNSWIGDSKIKDGPFYTYFLLGDSKG